MGYWSIDDDATENMWGDEPAETLDEYLNYLVITDRDRLLDRRQLIEDAKILTWEGYHNAGLDRELNEAEIEYGLNCLFSWKDDYLTAYQSYHGWLPEVHVPAGSPSITYQEIENTIGFHEDGSLMSYMFYLKECYPKRLVSKTHMLEATRLLTYYEFYALKNRPATDEEIAFILEACLHQLPWMALVK